MEAPNIIIPAFNEKPFSWQAEVERNIRTGLGREKVMMKEAAMKLRRAEEALGPTKTVDGLGKKIGTIPARLWFRWHKQEFGCWEDKKFVHEMLRDNEELRAV